MRVNSSYASQGRERPLVCFGLRRRRPRSDPSEGCRLVASRLVAAL